MHKFFSLQCLVLLLVLCVRSAAAQTNRFEYAEGGIVRGPKEKKRIALEFTADTFSTGAGTILDELDRHHAKASFFLTGNFLRNSENQALVRHIIAAVIHHYNSMIKGIRILLQTFDPHAIATGIDAWFEVQRPV